MAPALLLDLAPELLCSILCHLQAPHDLLRLGRASRRSRTAVAQCSEAWRTHHLRLYGQPKQPVQDPGGWLPAFRAKYVEEASTARVDRKVRLIKAQSAAQIARADVAKIKEQLEQQRSRRSQLQEELASIRRCREAAVAVQSWQPVVVQRFHQQVLEAQPVEPAWRERSIQQDMQDVGMQLAALQTSLAKRKKELAAAARRLQVMQG